MFGMLYNLVKTIPAVCFQCIFVFSTLSYPCERKSSELGFLEEQKCNINMANWSTMVNRTPSWLIYFTHFDEKFQIFRLQIFGFWERLSIIISLSWLGAFLFNCTILWDRIFILCLLSCHICMAYVQMYIVQFVHAVDEPSITCNHCFQFNRTTLFNYQRLFARKSFCKWVCIHIWIVRSKKAFYGCARFVLIVEWLL